MLKQPCKTSDQDNFRGKVSDGHELNRQNYAVSTLNKDLGQFHCGRINPF